MDVNNAPSGEHGRALAAACFKGNITIVWLHLDHGAHVNAQGGVHSSALQTAAASLRGTVVLRLLLDAGANVTLRGSILGLALIATIGTSKNAAQ